MTVTLEVDRDEARLLVRLLRSHHVEAERMLQRVEETEGLDQTKWRVRRELTAELDVVRDLLVKAEAAAKEGG